MGRTVVLYGLLDQAPSPRAPDPYVFGDPRGPVPGEPSWPTRHCAVHDVGWRGPGGCWCCGPKVTG